jgi:hypothetical protein
VRGKRGYLGPRHGNGTMACQVTSGIERETMENPRLQMLPGGGGTGGGYNLCAQPLAQGRFRPNRDWR